MKKCRLCGNDLSMEYLSAKAKQKSDRIKQARVESKARGDIVGRQRTYDREKIKELRLNGFTIREIAKHIGCSIFTAHLAIKELAK